MLIVCRLQQEKLLQLLARKTLSLVQLATLCYMQASFQFSGEAMEVVPLLECGSCVVQLSLSEQSLLISTLARSLLLDMNSGRVTQVSLCCGGTQYCLYKKNSIKFCKSAHLYFGIYQQLMNVFLVCYCLLYTSLTTFKI